MAVNASLVAYYGEKRGEFGGRLSELQNRAAGTLGSAFELRPLNEVHATVIGLEQIIGDGSFDHYATSLARYIRNAFSPGLVIQLGGFQRTGSYRMTSQGSPLYERAFSITGRKPPRDVMAMGWPVSQGSGLPGDALDRIRRRCGEHGFLHKCYGTPAELKPDAVDADCYMSLGRYRGAEIPTSSELSPVRDFLSQNPLRAQLGIQDLSLVLYDDPSLPAESTRVYSLADAANVETFRKDASQYVRERV